MPRRPKTLNFWQGRLPHWEVEDGRDFVTLHLAGAIPAQGHARIRELAAEVERASNTTDRWLKQQRKIFAEMEAWLDNAPQVRHLQNREVANAVVEAIQHRHATEWQMFEYVIMPSHLHLFFELRGAAKEGDSRLKSVLEQFKRWTGHQASKHLPEVTQFWQDEWFDHWSRSDEEDDRIIAYIRQNPVKAGLVDEYLKWPYGSWSK